MYTKNDGMEYVIVAVARWGTMGIRGFTFDEPGTWEARWAFEYEDENLPGVEIIQTIEVGPVSPEDGQFLSRLGHPDVFRELMGEAWFTRLSDAGQEILGSTSDAADHRALLFIAELLKVTRESWVGDAVNVVTAKGDLHKTANTLLRLAKEFPDSSYAPYAAYYAGCCYSAMGLNRVIATVRGQRIPGQRKDRAREVEKRISLTKNDSDCARGYEAFALAAERGDAYLKPRALYQQASLRLSVGAFDEMESLLDRALKEAPGKGTIDTMVTKFRSNLARARQKLQASSTIDKP